MNQWDFSQTKSLASWRRNTANMLIALISNQPNSNTGKRAGLLLSAIANMDDEGLRGSIKMFLEASQTMVVEEREEAASAALIGVLAYVDRKLEPEPEPPAFFDGDMEQAQAVDQKRAH